MSTSVLDGTEFRTFPSIALIDAIAINSNEVGETGGETRELKDRFTDPFSNRQF